MVGRQARNMVDRTHKDRRKGIVTHGGPWRRLLVWGANGIHRSRWASVAVNIGRRVTPRASIEISGGCVFRARSSSTIVSNSGRCRSRYARTGKHCLRPTAGQGWPEHND